MRTSTTKTRVLPPDSPAALADAWRAAVRVRMRDSERGAAICDALARIEWRWLRRRRAR